jgi:dethiobiotin synthetase
MRGLLITGTDTGVGKTQVTAGIARCLRESGRRVGALKPVATGMCGNRGSLVDDDAVQLVHALGGDVPPELVTPLCFREPLAPSVAARLEDGRPLAMTHVIETARSAMSAWSSLAEILLVEGVGGFCCPLAEGTTFADLAFELDFPVLVVARRSLGTLGHTLLVIDAALRRSLRVAGVVLNETEPTNSVSLQNGNFDELARRLDGIPILAEVPFLLDPATLCAAVRSVDWYERARSPRWA